MLTLPITNHADKEFIDFISPIVNGAAYCYRPNQVYVMEIDHWFDHKWLFFAGVVDLQLGVWRNNPLVPPPFNPNRVTHQLHFQRNEEALYEYEIHQTSPIHIHQWSWSNLKRKLNSEESFGMYVWYSGAAEKNGKGSLMIYNATKENSVAWYVSFTKKDIWIVNKTKSITKQEIVGFLNFYISQHSNIVSELNQ